MPKQFRPIQAVSLTATEAILANRFVSPTGAVATAAGNALGVSQFDSSSTSVAIDAYGKITLTTLGTAQVEASAPISAGALVEAATGGKAVTKSSGVALGRALEAASGSGAVIEISLIPN